MHYTVAVIMQCSPIWDQWRLLLYSIHIGYQLVGSVQTDVFFWKFYSGCQRTSVPKEPPLNNTYKESAFLDYSVFRSHQAVHLCCWDVHAHVHHMYYILTLLLEYSYIIIRVFSKLWSNSHQLMSFIDFFIWWFWILSPHFGACFVLTFQCKDHSTLPDDLHKSHSCQDRIGHYQIPVI